LAGGIHNSALLVAVTSMMRAAESLVVEPLMGHVNCKVDDSVMERYETSVG
jgi:hypothetical protein